MEKRFKKKESIETLCAKDRFFTNLRRVYVPSQITGPLRIGIHGVLLRCETSRESDKGKDNIFYHNTFKWFEG